MKEDFPEEIKEYKRELEQVVQERDHIKEALDETIEFCDTVSYEHDLLLIQNRKLKKILSLVTDKLIRIDSKLIKDIDFSEIINDPCKDFKPTGILDEKQENEHNKNTNATNEDFEIPEPIGRGFDMPFSENAGKNINKKNVPFTPKFTLSNEEFDETAFKCVKDHTPTQAGFLSMSKGDVIKKISELDEWYFGENLSSGARGFFTPDLVSK